MRKKVKNNGSGTKAGKIEYLKMLASGEAPLLDLKSLPCFMSWEENGEEFWQDMKTEKILSKDEIIAWRKKNNITQTITFR